MKTFYIFVFVFFMTSICMADPQYSVLDLGTLGGQNSYAYGINDSGQIVGYSLSSDGHEYAFRTMANTAINPSTDNLSLGIGLDSHACGINNAGQVVGYYYDSSWYQCAFRTSANQPISLSDKLSPVGAGDSVAYAINNSGQVTGYIDASGTGDRFAYRTAANSPINISTDLLSTDPSYGYAINNSGQVVGDAMISGNDHAFCTTATGVINVASDLGTLGGSDSYTFSINSSGKVVGFSSNSVSDYHAFHTTATGIINPATDDMIPIAGTWSCAYNINDYGQIVGQFSSSGTSNAFICQKNGSVQDLNSLISSTTGWTLINASAINNNEQIVGWGTNANGDTHAFLLSPIPTRVTWNGSVNSTWSSADTNFTGRVTERFLKNDNVVFNDTSDVNSVAVDAGGVTPGSVTFSNNTKAFTLAGGDISGPGSLTVSGGGTVTLDNNNSYTGGTIVEDGTLIATHGSALPQYGSFDVGVNGTLILMGTDLPPPLSDPGLSARFYSGNVPQTAPLDATFSSAPEPSSIALLFAAAVLSGLYLKLRRR